MRYSVIIPARNEASYILQTVEALDQSRAAYRSYYASCPKRQIEIILVDDGSTDSTAEMARLCFGPSVTILSVNEGSCGRSRNRGATVSTGSILVFVDADTIVPHDIFFEIDAYLEHGRIAGLYSLTSKEPGMLPNMWWYFWHVMRSLPLSNAKAMPACSFCTRTYFYDCGGFSARVAITEEWNVFATLYRKDKVRLQCATASKARTSSRRINGLSRMLGMFTRWSLAVFFPRTRMTYPSSLKTMPTEAPSKFQRIVGRISNRILRVIELNTLRIKGQYVSKYRRFYSPIIIRLANLFFCVCGEPLRILGDNDWMSLERERFAALHNSHVICNRGITFPRLKGVSLANILIERSYSDRLKMWAIRSSIEGLAHLHSNPVEGSYAHGDAHVGNVLVDVESKQSFWFDFETKLDKRLLRSEQIAYDIVVFCLSVAEFWSDAPFSDILALVFSQQCYNDLLTLNAAYSELARLSFTPTLFEKARFYRSISGVGRLSAACAQILEQRFNLKTAVKGDQNGAGAQKRTGF